jgi:hypothetical protein
MHGPVRGWKGGSGPASNLLSSPDNSQGHLGRHKLLA